MSQTTKPRSFKWGAIAAIIVVAAVVFAFIKIRSNGSKVVSKPTVQPLTVPEGEAGKVGDLQVSEEALQLAKITIKPVDERLVAEKIFVSGSVKAGGDQLVKVTPRVAGKVIKLLAQTGDPVKSGQSLAVLESTELAQAQAIFRQATARMSAASKNLSRQKQLANLGQFGRPQVEEARTKSFGADSAINQAENELSERRTDLASAESERDSLKSKVTQALAELEVSRAKRDRAEALFKEELISRQDLERIRADFQKTSADLDVAKASLGQGETKIAGAKASVQSAERELRLAKQQAAISKQSLEREEKVYKGQFLTNREIVQAEAELRLAQVETQSAADGVRLLGGTPGGGNTFTLTTPISGRVQERTATLGETIDSQHAAFTVVNLDQVWAELAISPNDLRSVRNGDTVELTSEAVPGQTFKGLVLAVGTQADETTRTVSVRTTLGNVSNLLKPGSFVKGSVVTDVRQERVTVPIGAIQDHTGKPTVYVSLGKPGAFEVRHVKLGAMESGWREISEGLKPGEKVAASGTFYLKSEALKSSLSDGCCAPGG